MCAVLVPALLGKSHINSSSSAQSSATASAAASVVPSAATSQVHSRQVSPRAEPELRQLLALNLPQQQIQQLKLKLMLLELELPGSDDDDTDSSGLEDNSDYGSTILEERTLDAHDIFRSGLIFPLHFSSLLEHRYFVS